MSQKPRDILSQVSHLEMGGSAQQIYDDWSTDYDNHLLDEFGYISPEVAARELASETDQRNIEIIDYGCGTGLVGTALRAQGFDNIDGLDISQGMLDQARHKQAYRQLNLADLTVKTTLADDSYDAALCIGSMGAGHVGTSHVPELLRALRPGGIFIIIINGRYYASEGFDQAFKRLQTEGLWQIRKLDEFNYMSQLDRPGWLLVAQKS